jgi:hypothetical protein
MVLAPVHADQSRVRRINVQSPQILGTRRAVDRLRLILTNKYTFSTHSSEKKRPLAHHSAAQHENQPSTACQARAIWSESPIGADQSGGRTGEWKSVLPGEIGFCDGNRLTGEDTAVRRLERNSRHEQGVSPVRNHFWQENPDKNLSERVPDRRTEQDKEQTRESRGSSLRSRGPMPTRDSA